MITRLLNGSVFFLALLMLLLSFSAFAISDNKETTSSSSVAGASVKRGEAYYTTCLGCHGVYGQGIPSMHAPNLTLQGSDYLIRQLQNFRAEVRGGVADYYGWMMNGRAKALPSDEAVRDVAAYIETLPDSYADSSLKGNITLGGAIYKNNCIACHGINAKGNPALGAPQLAGLDGYYQIQQLRNFKSGIRGSNQKDEFGVQMVPFANMLKTEKEIISVISYILSIDE